MVNRSTGSYNHLLRRSTAVVIITLISLGGTQIAQADDYDDAVNRAKQNENNASSAVSKIESQLANVEAQAQTAEDNAMAASYAYNDAKSQLVLAQQKLEKANKDALEARIKVEKARKSLGNLARTIYTNQGSLNEVSIYLKNDGLENLAMQKVALELFGANADSKLKEFKNLKKVADVIVDRAAKAQKDTEKLVAVVSDEKSEMDSINTKTHAELDKYKKQKDELIVSLAKARGVTLAAEQARQNKRAAEKRAREEAAKQAALARAEAAAKRASSSSGRSASSSPARNNPAPSAPAYSGNVRGEQVVAYARNFIGVPYVWGGTTPNGFDCSGLMQYVFRHFGINLPRVSQAQRYAGRQVSASQAQPGDMVNYYTHVGLYIGNGYMIHAPQPGMRVQVSRVYGNPAYVRVL